MGLRLGPMAACSELGVQSLMGALKHPNAHQPNEWIELRDLAQMECDLPRFLDVSFECIFLHQSVLSTELFGEAEVHVYFGRWR